MVPPVPIPNTVVKHSEAESTCLETDWEDRKLPVKQRAPLRRGSFFAISFDIFSEIILGNSRIDA